MEPMSELYYNSLQLSATSRTRRRESVILAKLYVEVKVGVVLDDGKCHLKMIGCQ